MLTNKQKSVLKFIFKLLPIVCIMFLMGCDNSDGKPWDRIKGKIAYSWTEYTGAYPNRYYVHNIYEINGSEKRVSSIKETRDFGFSDLSWKSDGSLISFYSRENSSDSGRIYNLDVASGSVTPLIEDGKYPAWSAQDKLTYIKNGSGSGVYDFFVDDLAVVSIKAMNTRPALSPDGADIAISLRLGNNWDQFSLNTFNTAQAADSSLLFESEFPILYPQYSPDGSKIAFILETNDSEKGGQLWVIDADGSNAKQISVGNAVSYPAWSPDGAVLAYEKWAEVASPIEKVWMQYVYVVDVATNENCQMSTEYGKAPTWIE
ncbi:MAG: hypothetical protein GY754_24350 [bacterium]|nr:hypothetical protein [bacterium]